MLPVSLVASRKNYLNVKNSVPHYQTSRRIFSQVPTPNRSKIRARSSKNFSFVFISGIHDDTSSLEKRVYSTLFSCQRRQRDCTGIIGHITIVVICRIFPLLEHVTRPSGAMPECYRCSPFVFYTYFCPKFCKNISTFHSLFLLIHLVNLIQLVAIRKTIQIFSIFCVYFNYHSGRAVAHHFGYPERIFAQA